MNTINSFDVILSFSEKITELYFHENYGGLEVTLVSDGKYTGGIPENRPVNSTESVDFVINNLATMTNLHTFGYTTRFYGEISYDFLKEKH